MKKIVKYTVLFVLLFLVILPVNASSKKINIYFFNGDGCPHCKEEEESYLKNITKRYKNVNVVSYEVWHNEDNLALMEKVKDKLDISEGGVPLTIIGTSYVSGYSSVISDKLDRMINYYLNHECIDVIDQVKNNNMNKVKDKFLNYDLKTDKQVTISLPILGSINLKDFEIGTSSFFMGFIESFNIFSLICIIFFILVLKKVTDNKKKLLLESVFFCSSVFLNLLAIYLVKYKFGVIVSFILILLASLVYIFLRKKNSNLLSLIITFLLASSLIFIKLSFYKDNLLIFSNYLSINNLSNFMLTGYIFIYSVSYLISIILLFYIINFLVNKICYYFKFNSVR